MLVDDVCCPRPDRTAYAESTSTAVKMESVYGPRSLYNTGTRGGFGTRPPTTELPVTKPHVPRGHGTMLGRGERRDGETRGPRAKIPRLPRTFTSG